MRPPVDRRRLGRPRFQLRSLDRSARPGFQDWEDFTHATDELIIVLEGEMEFEVKGEVRHPQSGEALSIPAGAVQSARNIDSTTARWLFEYGVSA